MDYPGLVAALSYYQQQETPDASYTAAFPSFILNAEGKIYRDLDMSASSGSNTSLSTAIGVRELNMTAMTGQTVAGGTPVAYLWPVVVEGISARVGTRWIPYQLTSLDFLEMAWPDLSTSAAPVVGFAYYTMVDSQTAYLAPPPDAIYPLRIVGQWRPAPMSESNPTTWLGNYLGDLLLAAVILEAMIYQRDFSTGGDPQAVMVWERKYSEALRSAEVEEQVKKGFGPDFQPYRPTPLATPPAAPPGVRQ